MHEPLISYLLMLILADAGFVLLLGYDDLRNLSIPTWSIPLYLIIPILVCCFLEDVRVLFLILLVIVTLPMMVLIMLDMLGWGDLIVGVRIPVILLLLYYTSRPYIPLFGLIIGILLGWYQYYKLHVEPYLCEGGMFSSTVKVKREGMNEIQFIPIGVSPNLSDDDLAKAREILVSKDKSKCMTVQVLYPFIYLFSIGYALSVILAILT